MTKWKDSSDYVARFKEMYAANPNAGTVSYDGVAIPAAVTARVRDAGLNFRSLPNLVRQALLWDMGWVVGEVNGVDTLMQVLVPENASMASIALSWATFDASAAGHNMDHTECTFTGDKYYRQEQMVGSALTPLLKCAVELVSVDAQSGLLAQDALDASVVPQPRLYKHQDASQGWTMPAIHTLPRVAPGASGEATYATCPSDDSRQAQIIPCETKFMRAESPNKFLPQYSRGMTQWLQEFKADNPHITPDSDSNSPAISWIPIVVIAAFGALVITSAVAWCVLRRRRGRRDAAASINEDAAYVPGPATVPTKHTFSNEASEPIASLKQGNGSINMNDISLYRLDQDEVVSQRVVGAGAFAEVVLATYRGQRVAVKRLLPGRATVHDVQALIDEIVLLAGFSSPYIVAFVGATWNKPIELACVLEYMDLGDLRDYLAHRTPAEFPWRDKLSCIYSIVEGLVYLHSFPIIHRDLKSRNILLDSTKGTKLTDFGVSKEQTQETMTIGVGTYRWMAPEILKYNHYSVAADIFSFGMILSELSTHQLPYGDRTNPRDGKPLIDTAIMAMVVSGSIRPTFSSDMPGFLNDLALQCIDVEPANRPTAAHLSHKIRRHLESSPELDSVKCEE